ncbi:MAG: 50S ribosomal protein L29 [Proteobacteria bacterium]|jgi:large subunit ribosomal protein L29|nr:50S ribosomal protein L29 [Pseudomonadota bacterium]
MKARELRELTSDELKIKGRDLREELFNLRFQHSIGQLEKTARIEDLRRDIARILGILRERELARPEEKIEKKGN